MPTIYRVNTDRKAIAALDPDDALAEDEPSDLDSDEETEEPNHEPSLQSFTSFTVFSIFSSRRL